VAPGAIPKGENDAVNSNDRLFLSSKIQAPSTREMGVIK
jgi:hypothetical protein